MLKLAGKKIGMTHVFGEDGSIVPLTAIFIWDNCVISKIEGNNPGSANLLIGFKKVEKTKKISEWWRKKKGRIGTCRTKIQMLLVCLGHGTGYSSFLVRI